MASILLTSFLPGYFLLRIMDKEGFVKGGASIVLSNLLSLFVMFVAGFFVLLSGKDPASLAFPVTIGIELVLATAYYLATRKKTGESAVVLNKYELATLLSVMSIIAIGSIAIAVFTMPLMRSDMWTLYSYAVDFSKGFTVHGDFIIPAYPYLLQIYLTMLFPLSGLPSTITLQTLFAFSFLPVLAFYSMVKKWFSGKNSGKIPVISAYLSILVGFTSLYTIYLGVAGESNWHTLSSWPFSISYLQYFAVSKTYGDGYLFSFVPYMVAWRWIVGLTILFMLLYLLRKNSCGVKTRYLLLSLLMALGYLGHIAEVSLFIILLFCYELFLHHKPDWKVGTSVLMGLIIVLTFDFLAPRQMYVLSANMLTGKESLDLTYSLTVLLTVLTIVVEIAKNKATFRFFDVKHKISSFITKNWRYIGWGLLYLYFFCIVAWLIVQKNYNLYTYGSFTFVPFFVFPWRFGAVGLVAVFCIVAYLPEIIQSNKLSFFLLISVIGLTLEQVGNYFPFPSSDIERYYAITNIGLCIIAGYGIERSVSKRLNTSKKVSTRSSSSSSISQRVYTSVKRLSKRKILSRLLLFLLIIPGMLSTSLYFVDATYFNNGTYITDSELNAITYIKNSLTTNESVLTFSRESALDVRTFAGITVQDLYGYSDNNTVTQGLLATVNPYIITNILASSNVRFVYVAPEDAALLNSGNFTFNSFLKFFPKVFASSDVTVYEIPQLTPVFPNSTSSLGILDFSPHNDSLSFNGIDNYVEFQPSPSLSPIEQITVELRFEKIGNLNYEFPVDQSKGERVSYAFIGLPDQRLQFTIGIDSRVRVTTRIATTTTVFQDGSWHQVVGTYNGTCVAVYVDGVLENETTYGEFKNIYYDGNHPLRLGTHVFDAASFFKGSIGEVCIYNRTISTDEVSFSYRNVSPKSTTGLILWLDFNGDLKDNSGNGNDGENHGGQFELSSMYSEKDVLTGLFTSILGLRPSILYVDDAMVKNLGRYISNYTCIILTSDPIVPYSSIINWVSAGHTLLVFDANSAGSVARLIGLNFSSENLISVKEFNGGKIIYVDIYSLLGSSDKYALSSQTDLVPLKNALDIPSSGTSISTTGQPGINLNMTSGVFEVKGNLSLSTDLIVLNNGTLLNPNFANSKVLATSLFGRSTLTIQNATLSVSPSESYLLVKAEGNLIQGQILVHPRVTGSIDRSNSEGNSTIANETQEVMNFQVEELLARMPAVNASGEIIFSSLFTHVSPYILLDAIVLQGAKIQGTVRFDSMYISDPLTIFSTFHADGAIVNMAETTPRPTIPWLEILSSPYNIAFNAIFFVGIAVYFVKIKRQNPSLPKQSEIA
jgi:hypothetical protein